MSAMTASDILGGEEWPRSGTLEAASANRASRVLIVGAGERGLRLAEEIQAEGDSKRRVVGFVEDDPDKCARLSRFPVLGGTDAILEIVARYGVDEIIFAFAPTPQERVLRELVARGLEHRVGLKVLPSLSEAAAGLLPSETVGDIPLVDLSCRGPGHATAIAKRLLDVGLAAIMLVLAAPLLLLAALAILLESGGPVLFRQRRVGQAGREFTIYKLRTMVQNAEAATGPVLARPGDSRVTRVGRLLRQTRVDELPQLFNVLRGDMSLVGPRPERPEFVSRYMATVNGYGKRLEVRPGLTGLAQVYGGYATSAFDKLKYDWMYVSRCSLRLDFWILWRTVGVVLRGRGC